MKRNLAKFLTMSASFVATMPLLETCGVTIPGLGDVSFDSDSDNDDLKDDLDDFFDDLFDDDD